MSDTLFTAGPDWIHNALIHHNYDDNKNKWEAYVIGYRLAADSLTEKVLSEVNNRDTLIFPIVFLYRQYLELRLKEIIEHGSALIEGEYYLLKHHDLSILWTKTKEVLNSIWSEPKLDFFKKVDVIISEFVEVDKRSDGFRYPINKNGDPSLKALRIINLKAFKDAITSIIFELEGISFGISVYQAHKNEMESYCYESVSCCDYDYPKYSWMEF